MPQGKADLAWERFAQAVKNGQLERDYKDAWRAMAQTSTQKKEMLKKQNSLRRY